MNKLDYNIYLTEGILNMKQLNLLDFGGFRGRNVKFCLGIHDQFL